MNLILDIPVLRGRLVRLEPLAWTHATDLADAAEEDRSTFGYTWVPRRSEVDQYIARQLQQAESGKLTPLTQFRLADNRAVGCTAYCVNHDPKRQHLSEKKMVENGST